MRIAILLAVMLAMSGPASAVVGDLNLDGVVDLKDFFLLADSFGDTGPPEVDDCSGGAVTLSTAAITETRERTLGRWDGNRWQPTLDTIGYQVTWRFVSSQETPDGAVSITGGYRFAWTNNKSEAVWANLSGERSMMRSEFLS